MNPETFWNLTVTELMDMYEAVMLDEKEKFEVEHQLLAWQTALLMNATGNFKKKVTVDSLMGKKAENEEDVGGNGSYIRVDRDEKNKQLEELQKKFQAT